MNRKYNVRKIKSKRAYTFKGISEVFGVHTRTVQSWHTEGLKPLEGSCNPYLVMGADVRIFLTQKHQKTKTILNKNEFYCMRCREAVIPVKVTKQDRKVTIGNNKQAVTLKGNCPKCGCKVNRFTTKQQILVEAEGDIIRELKQPRKD